jgi:secernin
MTRSTAQVKTLLGCDTAVVLAPHTLGGATMLAKNSDRPPLECQPLFHAPRRRHREGSTVHCQYLEIPQAAETAALVGSRPCWLWGFEHGVNEYGVAIGNEAVLTREELPPVGLLGMDLVRLGLERGRTAREATQTIGAMLERYGQGGSGAHDFDFRYSGGFIVADHAEAYVLESSCRQWVARRVKERACISNRLTLGTGYDLASPDVKEHARERGWWDGGEPFDFAAVYSSEASDPLFACARLERSGELLARRGPRRLREMFAMLRDHYEAGEMPVITAPVGSPKSFSLCMHNVQGTTASMVAELPDPQSGAPVVMWACLGAPCTGIYFPLYPDAILPPALGVGGERPSHKSPWWRMKEIQDAVARAPERLAPIVWKHLRPIEAAMIEQAAELAERVRNLKGEQRRATLSRFMAQNQVRVMREVARVEAALAEKA